jgi:hypothetical protein
MKNPELGRKVLSHLAEHPEQFDMGTFGEVADCGTVACLAGHALIQGGYGVDDGGFYYDHDGVIVIDEQTEAVFLLGLTGEELGRGTGPGGLFSAEQTGDEALARFREIVEAAETAKAAAHG